MNERDNTRPVRQLFACFGQGDIAGVVALLTVDVEWQVAGLPEIVPWAGVRRGRDQVARYLTIRPETVELHELVPRELIAQDDTVVVLGHERSRVKPTDRACVTDWAMVFTVQEGQIARVRQYLDTAAWAAAYAARAGP
jgi:ketosteroid isomerase-like protein